VSDLINTSDLFLGTPIYGDPLTYFYPVYIRNLYPCPVDLANVFFLLVIVTVQVTFFLCHVVTVSGHIGYLLQKGKH
jgi:hypothetical protein